MIMDWNGFKGAAKRIEDIDIPRIGHRIGVGEDELHAFMDVEAAGSGFDAAGRPKMLFEPHVFYRNLSGLKRAEAVSQGLAYPDWRRNYPNDSYPRLLRAMTIDETAALKSSSWGLTQILGENHKMVGYDTVQDMVRDFMADEEHHLEATVEFLLKAKIDDDLRAHNWAGVARVWNGPAYKENNYDTKMAASFKRWSGIKDTPWSPGDPTPADPVRPGMPKPEDQLLPPDTLPIDGSEVEAYPVLRVGDGISRNIKLRPYVARAQKVLGVQIDGKFGPSTELAVKRFQGVRGLTIDGVVGRNTWRAMIVPVYALETVRADSGAVKW